MGHFGPDGRNESGDLVGPGARKYEELGNRAGSGKRVKLSAIRGIARSGVLSSPPALHHGALPIAPCFACCCSFAFQAS